MKVRIKIDKMTIEHPSDIYEIMKMVLKREHKVDRNKEHFWVLALSDANKILSLELVALGTNNRVNAKPADILAIPLQKQAQGVILIHNHPSESLKASEADKDFTDMIIQACRLVKIPVLDHVIITEHSYFSFKETGLLERLEGSNKYIPPYELEKMSFQGGWEEGIEEGEKKGIEKGRQEGKAEGLEQGIAKGKAKGIEEGLKAGIQLGQRQGEEKGLKKGRQEGKAEGLKEGEEKRELEIAKQMLLKGLDMQLICEMTGLSEQRIGSL